ncbi:protein-tyrosine-phosphatase MKP1-like [Vigna umbellata]|uniref:protein-tyrosine-phosphatase MKP1-like n=1 Tax=Vigna umbellata TaxID=87088 RepID=UPI001F5F2383|nr:protein-tyrosine-phosphatase MKP1-like [Vigna umbellata]
MTTRVTSPPPEKCSGGGVVVIFPDCRRSSQRELGKGFADSGSVEGPHRENRRFPPPPLTPRSQQNCKARSCLPPLQPLSIARPPPREGEVDFVYRTLWLQDSPSEDITSIFYDVFDYLEDFREQGGRVFVHCCQGVSRSTSLVIAYLMWREGQSFHDAFQFVKATRGIADPNMGFTCQLL